MLIYFFKRTFFFSLFLLALYDLQAQAVSGTRGLFHIPSAEMFPDKTFIIGVSYIPTPYFQRFDRRINPGMPTYLNVTMFPFMEVMFRYTHELNMRVNPTTRYFPDRMMTFRFRVIEEKKDRPALVFGFQDVTTALGLSSAATNYSASYVVTTKGFTLKEWKIKTTMGYAYDLKNLESEDYRGLFGGVELKHQNFPNTTLMIEHNSNHPITGVKHFFFKKIQVMLGVWDLKKMTASINYHVQL